MQLLVYMGIISCYSFLGLTCIVLLINVQTENTAEYIGQALSGREPKDRLRVVHIRVRFCVFAHGLYVRI